MHDICVFSNLRIVRSAKQITIEHITSVQHVCIIFEINDILAYFRVVVISAIDTYILKINIESLSCNKNTVRKICSNQNHYFKIF